MSSVTICFTFIYFLASTLAWDEIAVKETFNNQQSQVQSVTIAIDLQPVQQSGSLTLTILVIVSFIMNILFMSLCVYACYLFRQFQPWRICNFGFISNSCTDVLRMMRRSEANVSARAHQQNTPPANRDVVSIDLIHLDAPAPMIVNNMV